jgi:hypothetical protein
MMISIEEARWIVRNLEATEVALTTFRKAVGDDGRARNVAAILDLRTGRVEYPSWPRDRRVLWGAANVVLAETTATRREDVEAEAVRGAKIPPSTDVLEAPVFLEAERDGLNMAAIERQLKHAYEVYGEGAA